MSENLVGKVDFNGKKYSFNFSNNFITIFPNELDSYWKYFEKLFDETEQNRKNKENIFGITSTNHNIAFINIILTDIGGGVYKGFVPSYIIGKANAVSPLPEIDNFISMSVSGECIDSIFNPKQLIENSGFSDKMKPYMNFNDSYDLIEKFIIDKDKYEFRIGCTFGYTKRNNIITLKSYLNIDFNKSKEIEDILDYYLKIRNLFSFLYNRKYLEFDNIILTSEMKIEDFTTNEIKNTTTDFIMYVTSPLDIKFDLPDNNFSIKLNQIKIHFKELYKVINEKNLYHNMYPINLYDERHIDVNKFLTIAYAFESNFDKTFPNFKSNKDNNYKTAKQDVLNYIKEIKENKNKNKKNI